MLLGIWKNVEELEMWINLNELEMIIDAAREREHRANKFAAALKGIDLDAHDKENIKERFDDIQRRANSRLSGKTTEELEFDELGIEVEVD